MIAERFVNAGEEDIISHNNLHYAESGYKMIDNSDNTSYCIFDTKENVDFLCMKLNDQQDEINQLSNFVDKCLHVILDKKNKEIEQLKRSIDCQDKTIKEQCIKLDWASECGVKWGDEFKQWSGIK